MWRRLVFAALPGLLLGAAAPARGAPAATIPFHLVGSVVALPVRVESSDTLWFVLDTGAYHVGVDQARAEQLGLQVTGESQASGATGTVDSKRLAPIEIRLGSATLSTHLNQAFPFTGFAARMGHRMDGILGSELFRRYVVDIDYPHSTMRLYEPDSFHYTGKGERIPLTFTQDLPYVDAKIELSDGRSLTGSFLVDTGSSQAVILVPEFLETERISDTVTKKVPFHGLAVGGTIEAQIGRLSALDLGALRVSRPLVLLPPPHPGRFANEGSAGNLGSGLLRDFRVTFDYSRSEMILEPAKDLSKPAPYDASGLDLTTAGAAFDSILVLHVTPKSPAQAAGLEEGDRLVTVDGTPAARLGLVGVQKRLRRLGPVKLAVSRGARTWTVPLHLRSLL